MSVDRPIHSQDELLGGRQVLHFGQVPSREWLAPSQINPQELYQEVLSAMAERRIEGSWDGQMNQLRQEWQNRHPSGGMADHHASYILGLRNEMERKGNKLPEVIWTIGAAEDAGIAENLLRVFEGAKLYVIEKDAGKIDGARETLKGLGFGPDRVEFVVADATDTKTLEDLPVADMIDTHLFWQHLPKEAVGPVLDSLHDHLGDLGVMVVGDLAVRQWTFYLPGEHSNDPDARKLYEDAMFYVHGGQAGERTVMGAVDLGWDKGARRATAFNDASDCIQFLEEYSGGKFNVAEGSLSLLQAKSIGPEHPASPITVFIPHVLASGFENSAKARGLTEEQMAGPRGFMWGLGKRCVEAIIDSRIKMDYPDHFIATFVKT